MTDEKQTKVSLLIDNSNGNIDHILLDYWGEGVELQKGDRVEAQFIGPGEDRMVEVAIVNSDLWLAGWSGCFVKIKRNGEMVRTVSAEIPCP